MRVLVKFVGTLGLALGVALLLAFPTMWLWNWLITDIFELCSIDVYQAFGLTMLSSMFFKSSK